MLDTATRDQADAPSDDPVRAAVDDPAARYRLLAQARAILRDSAIDHEDVAQTALQRAWANRAEYNPAAGSVTVWLAGFVRYVAREHLRRAGRAPRQSDGPWDKPINPTYQDGLELADDRIALHRFLDQLPAKLREAIELKYLRELEYPAIAARLGISQDNARARVSRGFLQLRAIAAKEVRS